MADLTGMLQAAAGAAGGENLYIEDVFSTYLYTGTGAAQTITNGIDLDGEGGLIWTKSRASAYNNIVFDTERGVGANALRTNSSVVAFGASGVGVTAFNTDGYSLDGSDNQTNTNGETYASWTFRKAPKFFDVVTYTGTGVARTVAHNLGSVPGCIIVKGTSGSNSNWMVYHRANTAAPETDYLILNGTDATTDLDSAWNDTAPTDTVFTVGDQNFVNASGVNYVAYLFAHDDGGFGAGSTENVITCGSYTGNGSATGPTVTLGYEPQWLMIKRSDSTGDWIILDSKRDVSNPRDAYLEPNTSDAEATGNDVDFNSTSFQLKTTSATVNASGGTYIYVAIRADML